MKALAPQASEPAKTVAASYAYDITVTDAEGGPLQPAEGSTVTLTFALKRDREDH